MKSTSMLLVTAAIALVTASPAQAETFRCGSKLIQEGDTAGKVLDRCGEPGNKQVITEPVRAVNASGYAFATGATMTYEIWRYARGSRAFPAILRIEGGVVKKIEYER
jgi:hypothetical protein